MRRAAMSLCLVAAAGVVADGTAQACGDKPLVIDRHVRSQRTRGALLRASILVFLGPRGDLRDALWELGLEQELTLAGHTLCLVSTTEDLEAEIRGGGHDLLLADIRDLEAVDPALLVPPESPFLLPVVVNASGDEWARAAARFACIRRSPSAGKHYLTVIEQVLEERRAAGLR
jgi:hypothetical protein